MQLALDNIVLTVLDKNSVENSQEKPFKSQKETSLCGLKKKKSISQKAN
jgi:hypothetical protein